jgi:integrase
MKVPAPSSPPRSDLLDVYADHIDLLGGQPAYRRQQVAAAASFLQAHPDLADWMGGTVDERLVELRRRPSAWPLVGFAVLTGRLAADAEFLLAKNFGHCMARWTAGLFPVEISRLRASGERANVPAADELLRQDLPLAVAFSGRPPASLTLDDLDTLCEAIASSTRLTESMRRRRRGRVFGLRQLLFEAGIIDLPAQRRREGGPATRHARLAAVSAPGVRRTLLAYLDVRATVLRPKTINKLTSALAIFGEYLSEHHPEVRLVARLERRHVEGFLAWTATRECRGSHDNTRRVGPHVHAHAAIVLRGFLDDIAAWGWADAPRRRLLFATDIPRQPESLPRALAPDVDAALMAAVAVLEDRFARVAITVLRHTGLRIGELLDLELGHLVDYGPSGTWLRVPLGKLNNERSVPVDDVALAALDDWLAHRPAQRARPHPRHGHPAEFVFVEQGRRLGTARIQRGLADAATLAGLTGADGTPLRVVAHQLRHTWATELANAGMSMQALMTLLGHRSPEMTIRYARLASPTLKAAYDQAAGKIARRIPLAPPGRAAVPDRVEWLASEMLKTRVAHGYCSRELAAEACAYANICETCPNFVSAPEFTAALEAQLADVRLLHEDAEQRGWTGEAARHQRVVDSIERHLRRLSAGSLPETSP